MLQLTNNQTVFEYNDSLTDENIPHHPGFIRIDEIDLYQQYQWETINTDIILIDGLCQILYIFIHNQQFNWIDQQTFPTTNILTKIINRLKCITNDYNEYYNFYDMLKATTPEQDITYDRRYMNDEEYQLRLSYFIIGQFIFAFGEDETSKIFAKHYGDIVNYLFYHP